MNRSKTYGIEAESFALAYLQKQGLKLVTRNFYSRFGEIDLIMWDCGTLSFIEVKARRNGIHFGIESITPSKQKKLVKTASYYLLKLGQDVACRFDALIVDGQHNCEWLKNIITL